MSKERKFSRRGFNSNTIVFLIAFAVDGVDKSVSGPIEIKDLGSNTDIALEVDTISSFIKKNSQIFQILSPNGIAIYKNKEFTPDRGILKAFSFNKEITLIMGANFHPGAPIEGPESQIYKTQEEYLEWILYHELGHLFSEKFNRNNPIPESFSLTGQRRPIFVWDIHENSIEETFADYFATYFTNPSLLSENEQRYFMEIEKSITEEPFPPQNLYLG